MKVLSVKQPWASLIASGRKTIELRTWTTHYRGDILICASASPRRGTGFEIGPLGVTICVVRLVDIRPAAARDADAACIEPSARDHAWLLDTVRTVKPLPHSGSLGLRDLPAELARSIESGA